jgi:hypothetical protein
MRKMMMLAALMTVSSFTVALPEGFNYLGQVGVSSTTAITIGSIGTAVQLASGTATIGNVTLSDGTDSLNINPDGSLNVTATIAPSTQTLRGRNGNTITSANFSASTEALHVLNLGQPDLYGKAYVYKSSDNFTVGGSLTLTGLGKQVDLQAINNDCTFNLGGGEDINVAKNTAETFDLAFTISNPTVNLTAKSGGAICKVRITGAN